MASEFFESQSPHESNQYPQTSEDANLGLKATAIEDNETRSTRRDPLTTIQNGVRRNENNAGAISPAVYQAINTLNIERLREEMVLLAKTDPAVHQRLASRLTVPGKDVIRYHEDTESEDGYELGGESDDNDEEEDQEEGDQQPKKQQCPPPKQDKPIAVGNDETTPRYVQCENCDAYFDVTQNKTGDCRWHPGHKNVYDDEDFWADHDEQIHGYLDDLKDDSEYAEGYIYDCCNKRSDLSPCKYTRHKAASNVIVQAPPMPNSSHLSRKRKAEDELRHPIRKLWE
ncbi:hypothetical protein B7463_g8782, partial [Scytalidium lignicola]